MDWVQAIFIKISAVASSVLIFIGAIPVPFSPVVPAEVPTTTPPAIVEVIEVKEQPQEVIPVPTAAPTTTPYVPPIYIVIEPPAPTTTQPTPPPSAPAPSAPPVVESEQMPEPTPLKVYKLVYEGGDFDDIYYWGEKKLASATVNGQAAEFKESHEMTGDKYACIWLWDTPGGNRKEKVCGGFMARLTAPLSSTNTVVLTAEDGSTHESTITIE